MSGKKKCCQEKLSKCCQGCQENISVPGRSIAVVVVVRPAPVPPRHTGRAVGRHAVAPGTRRACIVGLPGDRVPPVAVVAQAHWGVSGLDGTIARPGVAENRNKSKET